MFSLTGTFLGHRALLLRLLSALVSSPQHFGAKPSGVTSAQSRGEEGGGGEGLEESERGEALVNTQRGEAEISRKSPSRRALLTTSVYFFLQVYSASHFYFHCYDLELAAWNSRRFLFPSYWNTILTADLKAPWNSQ